ncbi:MAG: hypothetical protein ACE5IR_18530 [bacterium]
MMKNVFELFTGLCVILASLVPSAMAEPIAPSAPLDPVMGVMVSSADRQAPDADEVKIPAYPGSRFCTAKKGKWGPTGATEVQLLSSDPYEKVAKWYTEKMTDWHCKEWAPGTQTTCSDRDPGSAGNYDYETFNVVEVMKQAVSMPCTLNGMQTQIKISYQPD